MSFFLFFESEIDPVDAPVEDNRADPCINIDIPFIQTVHPGLKVERQE